jgi:hypothetical protein
MAISTNKDAMVVSNQEKQLLIAVAYPSSSSKKMRKIKVNMEFEAQSVKSKGWGV